MKTKIELVQYLLKSSSWEIKPFSLGHAKANIALVKYWGKRNSEFNLPETSSFSISLPLGTTTELSLSTDDDIVFLNGKKVDSTDPFYTRLVSYLDLFRPNPSFRFRVDTTNEIPTGAGLASSASGYAALVFALNSFFNWNLDSTSLSILARLGSGSASRSIYTGFVEWHKGRDQYGLDSYAEKYSTFWPELRVGLSILSSNKKPIDSRNAMNITKNTSILWQSWPKQVEQDLVTIKKAIEQKDFELFGATCEQNALAMHATMIASKPSICYWLPETIQVMHRIWEIRKKGIALYFTMDAGPNIKLLFLDEAKASIEREFPDIQVLIPPS